MSRVVKSEWEFGELFPTEPERRVYSVGELTAQVRRVLGREFGQVWVTGEVSNLRLQSSGHIYFTLKDASAQLSCVLFRGTSAVARDLLEDGQRVMAQGEVSVYEPRGQYQLVVRQLELQGVGALQLAFEKLKRKLEAEGLFAVDRKRPLPRYPLRIGVVSSLTGAALRDVVHVVRRRDPGLELALAPCRVQGDGAAAEIVAAIGRLNAWSAGQIGGRGLDLILVTRGGGSLEDLWAFNEEVVARAVAASALPIVSAVGHEIDFSICDFVADLRAATPSAAAELITEGVHASRPFLSQLPTRLAQLVRRRLDMARTGLERQEKRLAYLHPRRRFNERLQRLDDLIASLTRATRFQWRDRMSNWQRILDRLRAVRPARWMDSRRRLLADLARRLGDAARRRAKDHAARLSSAEARLRLLSPISVLERGYSITTDLETGRLVRDARDVRAGTRLQTRLRRGLVVSEVREVEVEAADGQGAEGTAEQQGSV
jgi:exodeoxyribonuclease VII large subunit